MRIRLAENFRAVFYAPYYAALELGLYAHEGVDVDLASAAAPGDGVVALLADAVDLTWGGPMRVMKAHDLDCASPLVCFGELVARDPFYLVGRRSDFRLADLAALRFAAVSEVPTPWMCLQHDLRAHGIDPAQVSRAPDRSMAANFAALRRGELDVVQLFEPFVSMALEEGAGEVLYAASVRGPTAYTAFVARRDRLEGHRAAFCAMVRALAGISEWLDRHDAGELAAVTAPYFPEIEPTLLARALDRYRAAGLWSASAAISRQGFGQLAASLLSGGYVTRLPLYEDCVEQSLG